MPPPESGTPNSDTTSPTLRFRATAEILRASLAEPQCSQAGGPAVFGERTKMEESLEQSSQRYS